MGKEQPTPYIAQLYLTEAFGFGGPQEKVESGPNAGSAGSPDISRLTCSIGKVSAENFFDGNAYSHDPRSQFMNWAMMYNAAWDYPADAHGYTYGGIVELNQESWAFRYGIFAEPLVANRSRHRTRFDQAHGQIWSSVADCLCRPQRQGPILGLSGTGPHGQLQRGDVRAAIREHRQHAAPTRRNTATGSIWSRSSAKIWAAFFAGVGRRPYRDLGLHGMRSHD